jgi:hypothetical protein
MNVMRVMSLGGVVSLLSVTILVFVFFYFRNRGRSSQMSGGAIVLPEAAGAERRQHPRANVSWPVRMDTSEETITAETRDISIGGAFICCDKPLNLGETFLLTIDIPNEEPVIAMAEVVWSNMNVPADKVINRGMGIRFIQTPDRLIRLIQGVF